jgi:hypothetical protein
MRVGVWTVFSLWEDKSTNVTQYENGLGQQVTALNHLVVGPDEQTSVFASKTLGPDGCFGEVYFAPGLDHHDCRFRYSIGYQGTLVDQLDGFVHFHQTTSSSRDWTIFAGLQYHIGCGSNRPWDFVMPLRIRARQVWRYTEESYVN